MAEMDGHIQHLQDQLNNREALVETLSSNVAELTTKMDHLETLNRSAEHKIGTAENSFCYIIIEHNTISIFLLDCVFATFSPKN